MVARRHFDAMVFTYLAEELGRISPYLRTHITRFGAYATDVLGIEPEAFTSELPEVDFEVRLAA